MKFCVVLLLAFLTSCNAPFQGDISVSLKTDDGQTTSGSTAGGAGGVAGGAGGGTPFTLNIPFTSGTEASYIINDPTQMEFTGDLVRLKPKIFIDQNNTAAGFASGTKNGVVWDITNNFLRLNSTSNLNEHSLYWTPQVSEVILYYKLNEATYTGAANQVYDDGPGGFHGQSNGPLINSTGKLRNAATFDGVSHAGVQDYDYLENRQNYTIAFWFKPTNLNGNPQGLIAKRLAEDDNQTFDVYLHTNNKIYVDIDGSNDKFATNTEFENNKWYHIVLTFDGTAPLATRVRIFVNGAQDRTASETSTVIPNYTAALRIGSLDASSLYNFTGQIDEVVLWKQTLTQAEIQFMHERQSFKVTGEYISRVMDSVDTDSMWTYLSPEVTIPFSKPLPASASEATSQYSAVVPNMMNGLLAYWKFDEPATGPTSTMDAIGLNYGTQIGTIINHDLRSLFNQSTAFYGGLIYVNGTFLNNMPAFSIGGWISPFFLKDAAGGNNVAIIGKPGVVAVGMKNGFLCARSETDAAEICTPSTMNVGEWSHFMVTGDASTFSLYLNGKLINTAAHAGADYGSSVNNFAMGSTVWDTLDNYYMGLMDEVAVWNRALTLAEITNLYRRGGNTLLYQVRSCAVANCSDQDALLGQGWKGYGNDSLFYFSENFNYDVVFSGVPVGTSSVNSMQLSFEDFPVLTVSPNRYFQYKAVFRSNDTNNLCDYGSGAVMCSPELKSMTIGPSYSTRVNTVTNTVAIGSLFTTLDLNTFTEILGPNDCLGAAYYTVSSDGTNFYYYDGTNWVLADGSAAQVTDPWTMAIALPLFPTAVGVGTLQIKTYLLSDGYRPCEVDNLQITGTN